MEEIYKTIDGFENYEVSNVGNVKIKLTGLILKPSIDGNGYYKMNLYKNGKRTTKKIHKLVAQIFIKNLKDKDCIDHIDNNKLNNNISNLRWATISENNQNSKISIKNTSGVKGVYFDKHANKWKAQIKIDRINIHIGYFNTIEEARDARVRRANEAFGVFINSCEKS